MNAWLLSCALLTTAGLGPCLWLSTRGAPPRQLSAVSLAGTLITVMILLVAQGLSRSSYVDVALILAVLTPPGILVFTRLLADGSHGRGGQAERES